MVRIESRAGDRAVNPTRIPRAGVLLATSLLVAVATTGLWSGTAAGAPTVTLRTATATTPRLMPDPATDPGDPGDPGDGGTVDDPTPTETATEPEPTVAPPTEVPTDPVTTPPAPPESTGTPDTPPTGEPAPSPPPVSTGEPLPGQSDPISRPGQPRRGVHVSTGDVTLTPTYWNTRDTRADLRVTITNTGAVAESVRLAYTLPAGLTDVGTSGCSSTDGRRYRCGAWTAAAGARFSMNVRVRVAGDAWRHMPLNGSVEVTAVASGQPGQASDSEGFAVLFPPGPPVPGMALDANQVSFDITGESNALEVRLGNTGTVDAVGAVEVVLPDGVSVVGPPAGCEPNGAGRTRCALGTVAAGRQAALRVPVTATPQAQRSAPLAGAVIGLLTPRAGAPKRMQMSFRIVAAAAGAASTVSPAPTGSQGVLPAVAGGDTGGSDGVRQTALTLIVVSVLLVVLALVLATTSLRRRSIGDPQVEAGPAPAPVTD